MNLKHHECEDLSQTVLLKLWKSLPEFRYDKEKGRFRGWLCRITGNTVKSYFVKRNRESMALAWMNSAGVHQMLGYTVPTWYGYAGWGCLDYFVEQPGRYTFTEAFFANQHALIHRIESCFPTPSSPLTEIAKKQKLSSHDRKGMHFDKNVVVFYGDPAWQAKMKEKPKFYEQKLEEKDGIYTFTITGNKGPKSFTPVNTNGAQRGWRPIVQHFESRLKNIEIIEDNGLNAVVEDDFILIPNPKSYNPEKQYKVTFKAEKL